VLLHLRAVPLWTAGGALLLGLAVVGVRRWWRAGHPLTRRAAVGGSAGLLTAGYAVFWGPWFAAVAWGGIRWYGPMYALPTLVPLVVLTAPLLVTALVERRRWVRPALAVSLALSVWQAGTALVTHVGYAAQTSAAVRRSTRCPPTRSCSPRRRRPTSPTRCRRCATPPARAPATRSPAARARLGGRGARRRGAPLFLAQVPRGYYRRSVSRR
jgi:hypothetical protein